MKNGIQASEDNNITLSLFPNEILGHIFMDLDPFTQAQSQLVCRQWYDIIQDAANTRAKIKRYFSFIESLHPNAFHQNPHQLYQTTMMKAFYIFNSLLSTLSPGDKEYLKKYPSDKSMLIMAALTGQIDKITQAHIPPDIQLKSLTFSAANGHSNAISFLFQQIKKNPSTQGIDVAINTLQLAAENGCLTGVQLILKEITATDFQDTFKKEFFDKKLPSSIETLIECSKFPHLILEIIRQTHTYLQPKDKNHIAYCLASSKEEEHLTVLFETLKIAGFVDPYDSILREAALTAKERLKNLINDSDFKIDKIIFCLKEASPFCMYINFIKFYLSYLFLTLSNLKNSSLLTKENQKKVAKILTLEIIEQASQRNQTQWALHLAAKDGHQKIVEALLIKNAQHISSKIVGATLVTAAENKALSVVEYLLTKELARLKPLELGLSLEYAASLKSITMIKLLLKYSSAVIPLSHKKDAFQAAALKGVREILEILWDEIDQQISNQEMADALRNTFSSRESKAILFLIQKTTPNLLIDSIIEEGRSFAIEHALYDVLKAILTYTGINSSFIYDSLILALNKNSTESCQILLTQPTLIDEEKFISLQHQACLEHKHEIVLSFYLAGQHCYPSIYLGSLTDVGNEQGSGYEVTSELVNQRLSITRTYRRSDFPTISLCFSPENSHLNTKNQLEEHAKAKVQTFGSRFF